MGNRSWKMETFERAPAAFVQNIFFGNGVRFIHVNQYKIGMVAFSNKTAFFYLETVGHRMAHFFYYFLNTNLSFIYIMQHQLYGMLYQWQAGMGMFIVFLFFCPGMWGMVCSYHI